MRFGRFGMGADSEASMFEAQLFAFKTSLVKFYRDKAKAIAERETMRFKYLTGLKAKFQNIVSDMYAEIYKENNANGELLTRYIIDFTQSHIPMTSLTGDTVAGWGQRPYNLGGRLGINQFSPTTHILSEPFNALNATDKRPAYLIYANIFSGTSQNLQWYLDNYFLFGIASRMPRSSLVPPGTGTIDYTFPPSKDWVAAYLKAFKGATTLSLLDQYDYMVSKITKIYPSGNLGDIVKEFTELFKSIIQQTKLVVGLQVQIDLTEKNLAEFVEAYRSYIGTSQTLAQILEELHAEAEKADIQPPIEVPVGASVQAPPADEIVPPPPPPPESKSMKTPLMAAAAIGILMLLNKGKS